VGLPETLHPYVIVDVFTDVPLQGNQLGVFTDGQELSSELMQRTARELNIAETVFLLPPEGDADARLRIFTPATELPFAGHPVLGAAFVVGAGLGSELVRLQTGMGIIPIALTREGEEIVFGEMEQPIPSAEPFAHERELLAALGVERSGLPVEAYLNGPLHVYVELPDEAAVADLHPDMAALADLGELGVNCFAGSGTGSGASAGSGADGRVRFTTRMFGPALGVPEDPATGSAAGPLALHLARHGRIPFGQQIEIHQGAQIGRPSVLHACAEGSAERIERVLVGGSAVIVARGEYRLQ
jgi:trans-2,3-dihydro-3-hydroxyanthranilate isomerase